MAFEWMFEQQQQTPTPKPEKKKGGWTAWLSELGGLGGAGAGAAIGTAVLPGLGTLIGGGLGGLVGGFGGKLTEQRVRDPEESIGTSLRKAAGEGAIEGVFGAGPLRLSRVGIQGAKALAKGSGKQGVKEASQEAAQRYADKLAKPGLLSRVQGRAANEMLGASPSQFTKASDAGIDLTETYQKWAPKLGKNYDEILGKPGTKGGNLRTLLKAEEDIIQNVARQAGTNIRISGDDIIKELKTELRNMGTELGGERRREAMKAVIKEAGAKYRKGVTLNQALKDLRSANAKFGASVLDDTGDAVVKAAQKAEANGLRGALKRMFPAIESALDNQSELITLREVLKNAGSKSRKGGFDFIGASGIAGIPQRLAKSEAVKGRLARSGMLSRVVSPEAMQKATELRRAATGGARRGLTGAVAAQPFVPDESMAPEQSGATDELSVTETGAPGAGGAMSGLPGGAGGGGQTAQLTQGLQQAALQALAKGDTEGLKNIMSVAELFTSLGALGGEGDLNVTKPTAAAFVAAQSGVQSLQQLEQIMAKDPGVLGRTATPGRGVNVLGLGSVVRNVTDTAEFDQAAFNAVENLLRIKTGAAAPEQEVRRYMSQYLPQPGDDAATVRQKLDSLYSQFGSILNLSGQQTTPTGVEDLITRGGF